MNTAHTHLNVLIVDDEPLACARLRRLLTEAGIERITEAHTTEAALRVCADNAPDVVFMDIEMPDDNGLQAAKQIRQIHPDCQVVFCTAYDAFAVKAFELNAQDYLLKPFSRERLQQTLARLPVPSQANSVTVRVGNDLIRIAVDDIHYCQAGHKYVTAYHRHGEIILDESLNQLHNRFPEQFVRIHRNCLVNKQHLCALQQDKHGRYHVRLNGRDCALPVSRRNLSTVRKTLKHAQ